MKLEKSMKLIKPKCVNVDSMRVSIHLTCFHTIHQQIANTLRLNKAGKLAKAMMTPKLHLQK